MLKDVDLQQNLLLPLLVPFFLKARGRRIMFA